MPTTRWYSIIVDTSVWGQDSFDWLGASRLSWAEPSTNKHIEKNKNTSSILPLRFAVWCQLSWLDWAWRVKVITCQHQIHTPSGMCNKIRVVGRGQGAGHWCGPAVIHLRKLEFCVLHGQTNWNSIFKTGKAECSHFPDARTKLGFTRRFAVKTNMGCVTSLEGQPIHLEE